MKINYLIKCSLFLVCAIFLGTSVAFEKEDAALSSRLREKEMLAKQADKNLAQEVKEKFVDEKLFGKEKFNDMGLRVTARKGVVTLSGRVESKENIKEAVGLAKSVEGVKSVYSKLVVKLIKQPTTLSDDSGKVDESTMVIQKE